jgi:hypothetical protein
MRRHRRRVLAPEFSPAMAWGFTISFCVLMALSEASGFTGYIDDAQFVNKRNYKSSGCK